MTRKRRRGARGFGLIEVLISGTIMLIGIASAAQVIAHFSRFYRHQRLVTSAIHLCEGTMEELLVKYADSPDLANGVHPGPLYALDGDIAPTGKFTTSWTVTSGVPIPGTRLVVVQVTWDEDGRERVITMQTVRT